MPHVDEGTLHALLDGELGPAEVLEVQTHFATCPACAARLDEARHLLAETERLVSALEPPAGTQARAGTAGDAAGPPTASKILLGRPMIPVDPVVLIPHNPTPTEVRRSRFKIMAWAAGFLVIVGAGFLGLQMQSGLPGGKKVGKLRIRPEEFSYGTTKGQDSAAAAEVKTEGARAARGTPPGSSTDSAAGKDGIPPGARQLADNAPKATGVTGSAQAGRSTGEPATPPAQAAPPPQPQPRQGETKPTPPPAKPNTLSARPQPPPAQPAPARAAPAQPAQPDSAQRQPDSAQRQPEQPQTTQPKTQPPANQLAAGPPAPAAAAESGAATEDRATIAARAAKATEELDRERMRERAAQATAALDRQREQEHEAAVEAQRRDSIAAANAAANTASQRTAPTLDQAARLSSRIGLDEAARQLGGPLHAIDGMSRQLVGLVSPQLVPGADATRPVVRAVYVDRNGRTLYLDQQRVRPGQLDLPFTPQTGPNGQRMWMAGSVLLVLQGDLSSDSLRSLARRVR